eukprot:2250422-Rhodomonas_salina.3
MLTCVCWTPSRRRPRPRWRPRSLPGMRCVADPERGLRCRCSRRMTARERESERAREQESERASEQTSSVLAPELKPTGPKPNRSARNAGPSWSLRVLVCGLQALCPVLTEAGRGPQTFEFEAQDMSTKIKYGSRPAHEALRGADMVLP